MNVLPSHRRVSLVMSILSCLVAFPVAAQPPAAAPVQTAVIVRQQSASAQLFVASVLPLKRAVIGSAVDGRVIELAAEEGDRIEAKQPLAQLLTGTIELELTAAVAELDLRNQELIELRNGALPDEIEQAKAKMLGAQASSREAQINLKRIKRLRDGQAVSQGEYDQAIALATLTEQRYIEFKAAYDLAVKGPRKERIAQAEARVSMQAAIVDRIKDRIKKYTIVSRFDGYIIEGLTETGAWLKAGDPVVEVVSLDEVEVQGFVGEQHITYVRPGLEVRVEVPSIPDRIFTGVVTKIIPQADMQARTFPVRVLVKNEITENGPLIKAGMYARIALPTGKKQDVLMVPKDALVLGGQSPTVYVVDASEDAGNQTGVVRPVPVSLGVASGNLIEVKGGVEPGQRVVVMGNERLRPGQGVKVISVGTSDLDQ